VTDFDATTDHIDDLSRILGYQDAAAEIGDRDARLIGPEMIAVPFWTPSFCAAVIRAAELVGGFSESADDPVPGQEISLMGISQRLFYAVENDIGQRLWPVLNEWWPAIDYHGLRDAFVIKYSMAAQRELRLHHDVAQVSASIKLNNDYTGAELRFPRQDTTNAGLGVGELLAWPSLVTHPHETAPLLSGTKYALTIWCELPTFE